MATVMPLRVVFVPARATILSVTKYWRNSQIIPEGNSLRLKWFVTIMYSTTSLWNLSPILCEKNLSTTKLSFLAVTRFSIHPHALYGSLNMYCIPAFLNRKLVLWNITHFNYVWPWLYPWFLFSNKSFLRCSKFSNSQIVVNGKW